MSAIGDYIHLTYNGYAKGPELGSGKPPFMSNAGAAINAHRRFFYKDVDNMDSKIIPKLKEEINKKLQLINAFQEQYAGTKDIPEMDEAMQELLSLFMDKMSDKWFSQDALIAAANGLLSGSGMFSSQAPTSNKTNLTTIQSHSVSTANQQLDKMLNGLLNDINFLVSKGKVSESEVQTQIKISQSKITNFINYLSQSNKTLNTADGLVGNQIKNLYSNIQDILINPEDAQIQKDIKSLINAYIKTISSTKTLQNWKGEGGESFTYAVVSAALANAFKSVASLDVVGTTGRSVTGLDSTFFRKFSSKHYNELIRKAQQNTRFQYGDFIASSSLTKANKVDVLLQMKNGSDVGISVKNYGQQTVIKKGFENNVANALTLLQNENGDDNFINHYLNLNSLASKYPDLRQDLNQQEAYKIVKQILIVKLITGYNTISGSNGQTQTTAKLLIRYNDKGVNLANGQKGASVEIYSMRDVIRQGVFKNSRYDNLKGLPDFLTNEKDSSAEARIHKILMQLAVPVSYSVKYDDIKDYQA